MTIYGNQTSLREIDLFVRRHKQPPSLPPKWFTRWTLKGKNNDVKGTYDFEESSKSLLSNQFTQEFVSVHFSCRISTSIYDESNRTFATIAMVPLSELFEIKENKSYGGFKQIANTTWKQVWSKIPREKRRALMYEELFSYHHDIAKEQKRHYRIIHESILEEWHGNIFECPKRKIQRALLLEPVKMNELYFTNVGNNHETPNDSTIALVIWWIMKLDLNFCFTEEEQKSSLFNMSLINTLLFVCASLSLDHTAYKRFLEL